MARDFTKNTANSMSLGAAGIANAINGAAVISVHVWFNYDTTDTGANNNRLLNAMISTALTGLMLAISDGSTNVIRAGARSVNTDGFQTKSGTTAFTSGVWNSGGAVYNIAGDTITPYTNGVAEGGGGVTFTNTTWSPAASTDSDSIGCSMTGSSPPSTTVMVDGRIAEVAIWTSDIGAAAFGSLSKGWSPKFISPSTLVCYMRLLGVDSPEVSLVGSFTGTIAGSLPQAAHPPVFVTENGLPPRLNRAVARASLF